MKALLVLPVVSFLIFGIMTYHNKNSLDEGMCYIQTSKTVGGYYKVLKELDYSYILLPSTSYSKVDNTKIKEEYHGKVPGIYAKAEIKDFEKVDCFEGDVLDIYIKLLNESLRN